MPAAMKAWPRERRDLWEITRDRTGRARDCPGHFLEPVAEEFLERNLNSFGCSRSQTRSHSLIVFGDLELHTDDGLQCHSRPGSFFHIVLHGSGTLRMPTVRDKGLRSLELTPGLVFVFNPNVRHAVTNVAQGDMATLSAVVPRRFWDKP